MTAPANERRSPLSRSTVARKIGANSALRFATRRQEGGCGTPRIRLVPGARGEDGFFELRDPDDLDGLSARSSLALSTVSFPSLSISTSS